MDLGTWKLGFTLVEVLIAIALTAVVMLSVFSFWRFFTQNLSFATAESNAVDTAEYISSQMVREIREMKESETGAYPLVTTNDQELTYYADPDGDNRIERVRYVLQGRELKRGVIEPTGSPATYPVGNEALTTVTSKVTNESQPVFSFYNGNYPQDTVNNPLPATNRLLLTRMIKIDLMVDAPSPDGSVSATVSKTTTLRAVKNN